MTAIKNLETKLNELTQLVQKLGTENAVLKCKLDCMQESVEALEGHGIDLDFQMEAIRARLREQAPSSSRVKILNNNQRSYLRLVD